MFDNTIESIAKYCDQRSIQENKIKQINVRYFPEITYFDNLWTIQILFRFKREQNGWSCAYCKLEAIENTFDEAVKSMSNKLKNESKVLLI